MSFIVKYLTEQIARYVHIMIVVMRDLHKPTYCLSADGGLLLAASSLTNRYWTGSLWHFDSPDTAPDIERCAAGVELNCGISDAKWVKGSSNVIAACDSGEK